MIKNNRVSFVLAVLLLLVAAVLRFWSFTTLPPGLHTNEILDIRLSENVRQGYVQVFYNVGGEGREGFYHTLLTAVTSFAPNGMIGYHLLSAWLGLITLALVYALGRRMWGNFAGLASMGLLAFGFYPVLLSRMVGREALLPLMTTSVLLATVIGLPVYKRFRSNQTMTTAFTALGVLVGLSFYVHPAGLLIALMALVCVIYILVMRQNITRRLLSYISFAALVALIVATPYLVSAIRLPELGGVARLIGGSVGGATSPLERAANGIAAIGFRGDLNPIYNVPGRPLFDPISTLLVLIGVVAGIRYFKRPRYAMPVLALLVLLPLALLSPQSPSFLAFSVLLPVLALLFGLGVKVISKRARPSLMPFYGVTALLLFNLVWTGVDLFGRWSQLPEVQTAYNGRLMSLAHRIDTSADDMPTVVCAEPVDPATPRVQLTNGQIMGLMQHRQTTGDIRYVDCDQSMVFINGGGLQQVIMTESNTMQTTNPFVLDWLQRAQPIRDTSVEQGSVLLMEVANTLANTVGRFTTTTPVRYSPASGLADEILLPPVRFGGNLTFLGYQLPNVDYYPPGGIVTVTTYWRVDGVLPSDLRLFTHILSDPSVPPIAQTDILSVAPWQLQNRDVLVQVTYVPLSPLIPPGNYTVSTGLYQGGDKQRMPVLDGSGVSVADRLFLYEINVRTGD
jgi:hypothetical protein